MLRGERPHLHIGQTMDFMPIEVASGSAVFQGLPQTLHLKPMGTVHGGWIATPPVRACTTAEGRVVDAAGKVCAQCP